MKNILLLESNPARVEDFARAIETLGEGYCMRSWNNGNAMSEDWPEFFDTAALVSLGDIEDEYAEVSKIFSGYLPTCPVIIHSSKPERCLAMLNELRRAGWHVEKVSSPNPGWIRESWLPKATDLIQKEMPLSIRPNRPAQHDEWMQRAVLCLQGCAIGDALGEILYYQEEEAEDMFQTGRFPSGPWLHTDDTEMTIAIVEILRLYGFIHQAALARRFAWRFQMEPDRGYAKNTQAVLREVLKGGDWQSIAGSSYNGQGSMGNGAAMRAMPIGAYFAEDMNRVVSEAKASAIVTHTHPEGVAGAVAVAVATAAAYELRTAPSKERAARYFKTILDCLPDSIVRHSIEMASQIPATTDMDSVIDALGKGTISTAADTVPYALWCAAHNLTRFSKAMAQATSFGGDCDTTGAIVGGIVAVSTGRDGIPETWLEAIEPLPFKLSADE